MAKVRIVWLRIGDLRLKDNPALYFAAESDAEIVPAFVWCPHEERSHTCPDQAVVNGRDWSYEATAIQALLPATLRSLDLDLHRRYGNRLHVLSSSNKDVGTSKLLLDLAAQVGAQEVHFNRREEPAERWRESDLQAQAGLAQRACHCQGHSAFLFRDPERCPIFAAVGRGMHVFKAFWDGWHKGGEIRRPVPAPKSCHPRAGLCAGKAFSGTADPSWPFAGPVPLSRFSGRPLTDDAKNLSQVWDLTEKGAYEALARFQDIDGGLARYKGSITRDAGPKAKESRLSPYFRLGLLSMVDVYWQVDRHSDQSRKWLRRCAWRDYAYWMLHHWQLLPEVPMRPAYDQFKWRSGGEDPLLVAWRSGRTGYPLVDAGMRELRATGYVQQNLRHTVGQFLVEVLGADWRDGEEWFHVALADSDLAINSMMWQHQGLAGVSQWLIKIDCHPVRHAKSADPTGKYVRQWLPELSRLSREYIHQPWTAPSSVLAAAGVTLGGEGPGSYPNRIVQDVDAARADFLRDIRHCRARASADCFRSDGCDLLTNPRSSGLDGPGLWALTERCLRGQAAEVNKCSPSAKGKSVGKGKKQNTTHEFLGRRAVAGAGATEKQSLTKSGKGTSKGKRRDETQMVSADCGRQRHAASDERSCRLAVTAPATQQHKRRVGRWRVCEGPADKPIF